MPLVTFAKLRNSLWFRDPRGGVILWAVLLAAILILTYAVHLWSPPPEDQAFSFLSGSPVRGASLFESLGCKSCHALYGIGPTVGPDLGTSIPAGSSPVQIVADMWNHGPQMWQKMKDAQFGLPHITEQDSVDLISYLYVVRYMDMPGNPDKGRELFESKKCANCHTLGGNTKSVGPDLQTLNAETPIVWAQRMWNHGQAMGSLMNEKKIEWPTFRNGEMLDLLTFLQRNSVGQRHESSLLPATPSQGKILFVQKGCANCHSLSGESGKLGPNMGPPRESPPSLAEFAGQMWNHSPQMLEKMKMTGIARPQFAEREMADLIAYLYLVRYLEPVGRVDTGRQVFNEKHCSNCHGADGRGGRLAPSLRRRQPYYAAQLGYTIWSHGPQMYQHMREKNIPWPTLNEKEMLDLVAFLNSI
jgi:mono/diheme cytochrome c family protein